MSRTKRPAYGRIRTVPRGFAPRDPFVRTPLFVAPGEDQDQTQDQVAGEIEVMEVDRETETGGIEAAGNEAVGSSEPVDNSQSPTAMDVTPTVRRPTPEVIDDFIPLRATGDIQEPAAAQPGPASEPKSLVCEDGSKKFRTIEEAELSSKTGDEMIAESAEEIAPLTEEQKTARLAAQAQQGNEEQDNNEQPVAGASGATLPTPGEYMASLSSDDSRSPTVRGNNPVVHQPSPGPIDAFVPLNLTDQPSVPALQPQPQPQLNAVPTAAPRARQSRRSALQLLAGDVPQNATAADDPGVFARTRSKTQPVTPAPAPVPAPAPAARKPRIQRRAPKKPSGIEKAPAKPREIPTSAGASRVVLRVPRAAMELLDSPLPRVPPVAGARVLALAPSQPQPEPQPRARAPAPLSPHPLSALQRETLQAQSDVLDRSIRRAAEQSLVRAREKEEIDRQMEQWVRDKAEIDRQLE